MATSLQLNNKKKKVKLRFPACWLKSIHPDQISLSKIFLRRIHHHPKIGMLGQGTSGYQSFQGILPVADISVCCLIPHTKKVVFLKENASVNLFFLSYVFDLLAISFASCAPRLPLNIFSASCRSYSDTTHTKLI